MEASKKRDILTRALNGDADALAEAVYKPLDYEILTSYELDVILGLCIIAVPAREKETANDPAWRMNAEKFFGSAQKALEVARDKHMEQIFALLINHTFEQTGTYANADVYGKYADERRRIAQLYY